MLAALGAKAQFWQGVELGGTIQYANQKGKSNMGVDLRASKRVCEYSRIRAVGGINALIPNGTDRYGTLMVGATADLLPAYVYADYGMSFNPSAKQPIGMAFDCGVGLDVNIASRWSIITELGIDRINSGKLWQSTPSVKAGVMYRLKRPTHSNISLRGLAWVYC